MYNNPAVNDDWSTFPTVGKIKKISWLDSSTQNTQTHQSAKQVDGLQDELLVPDPRDPQLFQLGMADPQEPFATHTAALKHANILLQTVVQTCKYKY